MLSKYKKKEAPSWQRKLVLVLGALCGATFLLFMVWAVTLFIDWARVDDCLDKGGSYDYDRGECNLEAIQMISGAG
jgi:hypothetical protein